MEKLSLPITPVLFLFLSSLICVTETSCSSPSASDLPQLIYVSPEVLDFGKVRPTDSPIKLAFDIRNDGDKSVVITDFFSGCGCTVVDIPKEPIPGKGKITVSLSVNVWGRHGAFENDLIIKTDTESALRVAIRGHVETDIWTDGQSLRCTVDPNAKHASTALTIYTTKYPDIVFTNDRQIEGIMLTETSRATKNGETAIRFSVEVEVDDNVLVTKNIHIVPLDVSILPLNIPLYCYRDDERK